MKIVKVKLLKSHPDLLAKIYDAQKVEEGYVLFANTGWWLVDFNDCEEIEE